MTIKDCLNRAAAESSDGVALRYKQNGSWQTTSFSELRRRTWHVSELLARLDVNPGDRVAILLENSPEWFEIYHGIVGIGAIAVPVDAKLREQELAHIFHDSGVSAVFCSARLTVLLEGIGSRLQELQHVIVLDNNGNIPTGSESLNCHAYAQLWEDAASTAEAEDRAFDRMGPTALSPASFIYTSGTTGRQKGAVLTHHNFMTNVAGIATAIDVREDDNFMLVLPLHHSFAFTCNFLLPLHARCEVSLVENLKTIKANMADCSPTVLLSVPLLLEKMLARVMDGINARVPARLMYRFGLAKVVGRRIHTGLGGALRLIVSGGAPINPGTLIAWNKLGIPVVEGYGITETGPVLTVNRPGAVRFGTVGPPLDGVEIKIHDPNPAGVGEILARGENVMQGYYNNPVETEKVVVDGWYHTGDLGRFDEKGFLVINGRMKSLIVNREGKNIYPEEVERQVLQSPLVLECLAMGYRDPNDGIGERVGLIAVPNLEGLAALEKHEGNTLSDAEIDKKVREDIRTCLDGLAEYKRPRRIEIRFNEFEKTTTQKIKRYLYAIDTTTE